jgi:thiol:disulfide interchange protein DsbD
MGHFTRTTLVTMAACAALTVSATGAQQARPGHARITLYADGGTADQPLTIGVRFQLDPGWHIFWRNPGGSGSPPTITWAPVADMVFGEIQWPVPRRFRIDAIVSYGYDGEVMLLVPAERGRAASGALMLTARADFAICRDVCVSETATTSLPLPAASAMPGKSADTSLFDQARAQLPRRVPPSWTVSARTTAGEFLLHIAAPAPPRTPTFFPLVNAVIDDTAAQRAETDSSGLTLHLEKSPYLNATPSTLEGVLLGADGRAFVIKTGIGDR